MYSIAYLSSVALAAAPVAVAQEEGMTMGRFIENLPTDPASIFTILLMVVFFGFVIHMGRARPENDTEGPVTPS